MRLGTILVPTDLSAHADLALELARELARRARARIALAHSFHVPPEALPHLTHEALQRMRAAAQAELESRRARAAQAGLACEIRWLEGPAAPAIAAEAAKCAADLIVMGSHGRTGVRYALLGSVAARVARTAPCPVLTVKQSAPLSPALRAIVVAMDFSDPAQRALAAARTLASVCGPSHLVLVHAQYVPPDLAASLAEQRMQLPGPDDPRIAEQLEAILVELQDAGISSEYITESGHPAEVLPRVATRLGADLIALGTHGRRGLSRALLGSVAEHVLRAAPMAVLTVGPAGPGN